MEKVEGLNIVDLLVLSEAVSSKRQAREDIQNKAIELNGEKISGPNYIVGKKDLLFGQYLIAKRNGIINLFPYNNYLVVSARFLFCFPSWRRIHRQEKLL